MDKFIDTSSFENIIEFVGNEGEWRVVASDCFDKMPNVYKKNGGAFIHVGIISYEMYTSVRSLIRCERLIIEMLENYRVL